MTHFLYTTFPAQVHYYGAKVPTQQLTVTDESRSVTVFMGTFGNAATNNDNGANVSPFGWFMISSVSVTELSQVGPP